jgi:beta-mannanase
MNYMDSLPPNIIKVWGPAGDRGSVEWYPGDDVVDVISMAIYGLPDKNITDPEKQESFATIFKRKLRRMRFINKPIFITEFGVKGPETYQTQWLLNSAGVIRENTRIIGINYFNMTDTPKAWGDIKPPDWSISKKSFHQFLEVLRKPDEPADQ